jgi:hypothetical protein
MEGTKARMQQHALPYRIEVKSGGGSEILIYHTEQNSNTFQYNLLRKAEKTDLVSLYYKSHDLIKSRNGKSICILMSKGSKVESVSSLDDLIKLDVKTKVAFIRDRMFMRRNDIWASRSEGAFVEWMVPWVSRQAEIRSDFVIAGNVEIYGNVVLDGAHRDYVMSGIKNLSGRHIIEGTRANPIEINGPYTQLLRFTNATQESPVRSETL